MANRSLPHDSSACPLCDDVPFDAYRRHWKHEAKAGVWHLIADVPTLESGRVPGELYRSAGAVARGP
jgi:hypothetical protein